MVNSLDRDVRKFKRQSNDLMLLIQVEAKKWPKRTIIVRDGKLTSVGGEIMPKDPPAFRVLDDQQMAAFLRGEIKSFAQIDRLQNTRAANLKSIGDEVVQGVEEDYFKNTDNPKADSKAKTLIDSAQQIIMDALEQIKDIPGKIGKLWASDDVVEIRAEIGTAISLLGTKAGTAYNNVSAAFSNALGKASKDDGEKSSEGFVARMKRELGIMASTAMQNIKDIGDKEKNPVIAGVGGAMAAIASFLSGVAGEVSKAIKAKIKKMLDYLLIPPEVRKKMEASIQQMNDNFEKGRKQQAEIEEAQGPQENEAVAENKPGKPETFRGDVYNGLYWDKQTKTYRKETPSEMEQKRKAEKANRPKSETFRGDVYNGLVWDRQTKRYVEKG